MYVCSVQPADNVTYVTCMVLIFIHENSYVSLTVFDGLTESLRYVIAG